MRGVGLLFGAVLGCTGGTNPVAPEPTDEAVVAEVVQAPLEPVVPVTRLAVHPDFTVEVVSLGRRKVDGGWEISAGLTFRHARIAEFDGLTSQGRAVVFAHDDLQLMVDDVAVVPDAVDQFGQVVRPGLMMLPVLQPRMVQARVDWTVAGDAWPTQLALDVVSNPQHAAVWLAGGPTLPDGQPGVALQPVDPSGAPITVAGAVVVAGDVTEVAADAWPVVVPAGEVEVRVPDAASVTVSVSPQEAVVVRPMVGVGAAGREDLALASLWAQLGDHDVFTADDLAVGADSPEELAAFVRDELGVLATRGIARSPDDVLRLGAGSPLERANLLRHVLERRGLQSRFTCGDLALADARALYGSQVAVQPGPAGVADWLDEAGATLSGRSAAWVASLDGWSGRPRGPRAIYSLVPEWCWVGARTPTRDASIPYVPYDLRPGADTPQTLPFPWRTENQTGGEMWRVGVLLNGVLTSPSGGRDAYRLLMKEWPVAHLIDGAVLIDVYPADTDRQQRVQMSYVSDNETAGRLGDPVLAASLESWELGLSIGDPRDIGDRSLSVELWDQSVGGDPPSFMRVLISADGGTSSLTRAGALLATAVRGYNPTPAVAALRARHELLHWLRLSLVGGRISYEPGVTVTVLYAWKDGTVSSRTITLPSSSPTGFEGVPTTEEGARFMDADALARAFVEQVDAPVVPDVWLNGSEALGDLPGVPNGVQGMVARALGRGAIGASSEDSEVWFYDAKGGAPTWIDAVPQLWSGPERVVARGHVRDATLPYAAWDKAIRCHEARRWAALLQTDVPAPCAVAEPAP